MRTIDADKFEKRLTNYMDDCAAENDRMAAEIFQDVISEMQDEPTISPEDLWPHGRWIKHIEKYENYCECSECHKYPDSPLDTTPYCPFCGAKMDEEEEDSETV